MIIRIFYILIHIAKNIFPAKEISNITTDFRFGFGTAMDKVIGPFVRRDPNQNVICT